ncbi:MAG TPA: alkaline phosphatase family protein [Myxococcota bacterium]|nr:alkaline phosphatase family protein [Myxococcota bacterium]
MTLPRRGNPRLPAAQQEGLILGPERLGGQGLDPEQEESGNRAILALLTDPEVRDQVDLVLTWRAANGERCAAYEVWSRRGLVRFVRRVGRDGRLAFEVIELLGENPLARQDEAALRTVQEETTAARASGFDGDDPAQRFIRTQHQSYPFAYERVAQLFDSPHAPDLAISPEDWSQGIQPGTHGALNVRQSRAPLWFAGPRVRSGHHGLAARAVDIAPTLLSAAGFPKMDGCDATGRTSSERSVPPDVYLKRQDGRVLTEILNERAPAASRVYIFLLDGLSHTELERRLASDPAALPALRRLRERAAILSSGSIVNFPSITWPSHTTIGTGAWCGHHDVVNPSYYLREKGELVSPQGQQLHTEGFVSAGVETIFEAFHRVHGPQALTASIYEPLGRGADHAVLEGRNLADRARLRVLTAELLSDCDSRWETDGQTGVARESLVDARGVAQVIELFTRPDLRAPHCVFHELTLTDGAGHDYGPHHPGLGAALDETDRRIGRVLDVIERRGLLEETLFVVTADHGMSPQDIALRANPARHVERIGMAAVVAEPMVWLRDVAVAVERAHDGRTARVMVSENDPVASGERLPVEGAEVLVEAHAPQAEGQPRRVAHGRTGPGGVFGFATPSDLAPDQLAVVVRAEGRNPRRLRLDGQSLSLDLRAALYGRASR